MPKTIENFRAEYGVRLDALSEVTGIPAQDLANSEKLLPVPSQTAQIIIEKYNLPPHYFEGISSAVSTEKVIPNTLNKFIAPSIVWMLLTSIVASVHISIGSIIISLTSLMGGAEAVKQDLIKAILLFSLIWQPAVIIISCNLFSKWLEKKYGFLADKRKFKYLYWIIPGGMIGTVTYILNNIFYNETILSAKTLIAFLLPLVGTVCSIVFLAMMLKAVSAYEEKDRKLLKFFYIFCCANTVLHAALSVLFDVIHSTFPTNCVIPVISACIIAVLVLGLVKEEKAVFSKKVCYTVLPLACLIVPNVIRLIRELYFLIILP